MSRNVFDQTPEEPETHTVPLRMGVGGPIIGEAEVTSDGVVKDTMITSEAVKKYIAPGPSSFFIKDPADRYRVSRNQDETQDQYIKKPHLKNIDENDFED